MKPFETKGLPKGALALSDPGRDYLVWMPTSNQVPLDLSDRSETFVARWVDPKTGQARNAESPFRGGRIVELRPPTDGPAVLWLTRE